MRVQIVAAGDQMLVKQYPAGKLFPKATRQTIIRKTLDMALDDLPLAEDFA